MCEQLVTVPPFDISHHTLVLVYLLTMLQLYCYIWLITWSHATKYGNGGGASSNMVSTGPWKCLIFFSFSTPRTSEIWVSKSMLICHQLDPGKLMVFSKTPGCRGEGLEKVLEKECVSTMNKIYFVTELLNQCVMMISWHFNIPCILECELWSGGLLICAICTMHFLITAVVVEMFKDDVGTC